MRAITARLLRGWRLPEPDAAGDKSTRGMVVCVGGAPELPGAVILAGVAALRAGAGVLRIGTPAPISIHVGVAVPEARVFGLPETSQGGIDPSSADHIAERAERARAVLLGPGMCDADAACQLVARLLPRLEQPGVVVLDALALDGARESIEVVRACGPRVVMTPHSGEMARLLETTRDEVEAHPLESAREAASQFRATVALKGADTLVVDPQGQAWRYREGTVGLATSGSGDTLAGIIAGLAARGAEPAQATAWGVYLHGEAGNVLTRGVARVGFLARELLDQVPRVMADLEQRRPRRQSGD